MLRVYIPAHFSATDDAVQELLTNFGAADLVTSTDKGIIATFLPFLYHKPGSAPEAGVLGALVGHVARNNDQWRARTIGDAMVIVRGPDAYITPSWYASKREHSRVVPTWNYITAHVYGRLVIHDDPVWVGDLVRGLTDHHEKGRPQPWAVNDAPEEFIAGQLRAIVGVEIVISRIEAKFKLSQNRPEADFQGVVDGLVECGEAATAEAMRKVSPTN